MQILQVVYVALFVAIIRADQPCAPREYGKGTVCVCNETYCDTVSRPAKVARGKYITYTSSKAGLRFQKEVRNFKTDTHIKDTFAFVDDTQKLQPVFGFGGAFTDAAGYNMHSLSTKAKNNLLRSYFSNQGIEYSLGRVPIGGSDFSTRAYSYDDTAEPDLTLKRFALQPEDSVYKIPFINEAIKLTGNKLNLIAAAWTAPKWMKTNNQYSGLGFIKQRYWQLWADYFVKFLDEYKKKGISFWGITTGNEPSTSYSPSEPLYKINSVAWTPLSMSEWIANNLGPALNNSQHSGIKLIAFDDSRYYMLLIELMLNNTQARNYVDGIGVHWYTNNLAKGDTQDNFHDLYPDLFVLNTEACEFTDGTPLVLGSWQKGENYARDILMNFHHWSTGWIDWNMALNTNGGPTYINNFVDSPIIVNATANEFYKQPMFYALGHFSKFIPPGSVRIDSPTRHDKLDLVAFRTPDNGTVIVILNAKNYTIPISITDNSNRYIDLSISEFSFTTVLYW